MVWLYSQVTSHGSELEKHNRAAYKHIMGNFAERKEEQAKFKETCAFLDSECRLKPRQ